MKNRAALTSIANFTAMMSGEKPVVQHGIVAKAAISNKGGSGLLSEFSIGRLFRRPPPSPDSRRVLRSNRRFRHGLAMEILEPRRLMAADVVVSDLLFRGDLVESSGVNAATGTAIQMGFNPIQGESFRPLVTLTGNTEIDPLTSSFQFQGTGAFAGPAGPVPFWNSPRLSTFDVPDLIGAGETISGTAFSFGDLVTTASTLTLINPDGGETTASSRLVAWAHWPSCAEKTAPRREARWHSAVWK